MKRACNCNENILVDLVQGSEHGYNLPIHNENNILDRTMPRNIIQVVIVDNWHPNLDAVIAIPNMKHLPTKDLENWIGG